MYGRLWNTIRGKISTGDYDMLVIDEFMAAYRYGLIPNKEKTCSEGEKRGLYGI